MVLQLVEAEELGKRSFRDSKNCGEVSRLSNYQLGKNDTDGGRERSGSQGSQPNCEKCGYESSHPTCPALGKKCTWCLGMNQYTALSIPVHW